MMRKWKKLFIIVCALSVAYVGGLYFLQNKFLFFPDAHYVSPRESGTENFKEVMLSAEDGNPLRLWYAAGDVSKPAVLFLHGNAGQIATFAEELDVLAQHGYAVLAMEYRSFAGIPGTIRQETIFQDATQAFDFLKEQGYAQIVVYGYSFGAAFSAGLVSLRPADGLVLTAPFYSLDKVVGEKPVPLARWVLKDHYPSFRYLAQFTKPLLIVHGKQDRLIPYHHAEALMKASASSDKKLYVLDGQNHHSVYFEGANLPYILDFLKRFEK